MAKIQHDKYYTSEELVKHCMNKIDEVIGFDNISEFIESSAGAGAFIDAIKDKPFKAFDILPEHELVEQQDFLKLDLPYKKGRLTGFNPPFGGANLLYRSFYNKAVNIGDYIAFILPIQLHNVSSKLYQFDLIYSEDLGYHYYSGVKLRCCFNIYKRPNNGLNPKPNLKLNDITVCRYDNKKYDVFDCDIRICYWGNSSAGKVLAPNESYSREYKIKINNNELRDNIISFFYTVNWHDEIKSISVLQITQQDLFKTLKKYIPTIK